jgi:hypothetical protein
MFYKAASPQSVTGPHKSSSSSNCPCTAHGSSDTPCCLAASPLGRHRHPQPKNWGAAGANPPIGDAASPTPPPVPPPSLCQRRPPLHCTPCECKSPSESELPTLLSLSDNGSHGPVSARRGTRKSLCLIWKFRTYPVNSPFDITSQNKIEKLTHFIIGGSRC